MTAVPRWMSHARGIAWPVIEQFAWPASQVLLAPILLKRLGAEQFGLWILALSFVFAAPALSFGRSASLIVLLPALRARSVPTAWLATRVLTHVAWVSVALLLGMLLLSAWWPDASPWAHGELALYACLVVALLAVSEVDNALGFALKGLNHFRAAALAELFGRAVQVAAFLLAVHPGTQASHLIAVAIACLAFKAGLKGFAFRRLVERPVILVGNEPGHGREAPEERNVVREMSQLGGWNCLQVASGLMFFAYDRWMVGYAAGAAALAAYGICSQYAQLTHSVVQAASQPLIPWAARRERQGDALVDPRQVRRVVLLGSVFAVLPMLAAWVLARPALALWIGDAFAREHEALAQRLCLLFVLMAFNVPFFNILLGMKQARFVALLALSAGLALVAVSWLLPPASAIEMANLKIVFAVISLLAVPWLWKLLKVDPSATASR